MNALYVRAGKRFMEAPEGVILDQARLLLAEKFRPGMPVLRSPELVESFLLARLSARETEVFAVILLDAGHGLISYQELFNGTVDTTTVHVREVVKAALKDNAVGVIAVHNHPSGCADPSLADIGLTRRLRTALATVDIRLVDHLIVGKTVTSFEKRGISF